MDERRKQCRARYERKLSVKKEESQCGGNADRNKYTFSCMNRLLVLPRSRRGETAPPSRREFPLQDGGAVVPISVAVFLSNSRLGHE